jgi:hypothetical protein
VKLYVLSKSHQQSGYVCCDACGKNLGARRPAATVVARNGNEFVAELRICAPCAREIARSAEPQS